MVALEAEEFKLLPPIATVIESDIVGEAPVQLVTQLTEVGTLDVECVAVDEPARRWQFAFQLRGGDAATLARLHPRFPEAVARLERFYGSRSSGVKQKEIKGLRADLERLLGKRESWETPLLRELFGVLWTSVRRRRRSAEHERLSLIHI